MTACFWCWMIRAEMDAAYGPSSTALPFASNREEIGLIAPRMSCCGKWQDRSVTSPDPKPGVARQGGFGPLKDLAHAALQSGQLRGH